MRPRRRPELGTIDGVRLLAGNERRRLTPGWRGEPREARTPQPGTITKVTLQVRDPERASLFINGEFAFGLPAIEVVKRGLKSGVELSESDIQELLAVDEVERAVQGAITFVSYRPRSEREVCDRLRKRQFSPPAIDQATLDQILGPTSTASITLITCAGTYDASSERYDQRLIVRAERVVSGG